MSERINPSRMDPVQALAALGTENRELHEELQGVYRDLDRYRNALTAISKLPQPNTAIKLAKDALAHKPLFSA